MHPISDLPNPLRSRSLLIPILIAAPLLFLLTPAQAQTPSNPGTANQAAVEKKINDTIAKLTLEEKITLLSGSSVMASAPIARLGIPALRMSDGPVGAHVPPPSTAFAAGIGLAASWDRELAQRIGVQLGRDARSRGASFLLGPGVNIYRAPMNGRNFEYFGEDPFLASQIAVGYIEGVQSQNVSATIKHFAANNSEYARFTSDSIVSERALREIYLPAFEAAVKQAHVGSIMDSYNFINGEHATQNAHLNIEIAKKQWGFDGIMMSDWTATHDGVAAANAGLDLEMPFGWYMNAETLIPAVKSGKVSEATIDDKIRRILRVAYRFGWIAPDGSYHDPLDPTIPRYNQQGRQVALEGALEGATLLKNHGNLLPLDPAKVKTIAVIGPDAFPGSPTAGGSGLVPTFYQLSAIKGISDRLGLKGNVTYDRGVSKLNILALQTGLTPAPDSNTPGVTVDTFDNDKFSGKPTSTRNEQAINSGQSALADPDLGELINTIDSATMKTFMNTDAPPHFNRWTGYYHAREAGKYLVFAENQGKYRLTIDGALIIDHSDLPRFAVAQTTIDLTPGAHKVVIEELSGPQFGAGVIRLGIAKQGAFVHPEALELAKRADAVIIAVGYDAESESEGQDREFQLPPGQDELIQKIAAINPNTVVVITAGGAIDTSRWIDHVSALLQTWYAGEEGGTALAQILFGDSNPSGRLPISWERSLKDNPSAPWYYPTPGTEKITYGDDIFVGYRGYEHNHTKPLFPFGYGLSYTTFKYANLTVTPASKPSENPETKPSYEVSFDVTNTGPRAGADVAQLYLSEDHPKIARPAQELKGFARVALAPGETRHITIPLDARSFTWYDVTAKAWHADPGSFTLHISRSSADPQLEGKITLPQPIILPVE
jgi:beta-glucosidase